MLKSAKFKLMRFIGSKNFYSNLIDELHVKMKPLYGLFHVIIKLHWNLELKTLFQQIKISFTKDVRLPYIIHTIHFLYF